MALVGGVPKSATVLPNVAIPGTLVTILGDVAFALPALADALIARD